MPIPHTVIYTHGGGRLGNQLLRFAHWMAWAREHEGDVEVIDMAFWPYAELFEQWKSHPACVYPVRPHSLDAAVRQFRRLPVWFGRRAEWRLQRVVHATGRWWPGWQAITLNILQQESLDLDDPVFFDRVMRRSVTTCSGWKIASWRLLSKQQTEVREFFRPAPEFAQRSTEFMMVLRRQYDLVIGLLIRQSDYREWGNGRFYFSTAQYAAWIRQLLDLHCGRRVAVVVASEDWQDPTFFAGLPVHLATGNPHAGGHWFENWIELSLCDFVVSAPSTFSATAAFLGAVPLWPLLAPGQALAFDQIITDALPGAAAHPVFGLAVK